MSNTLVSGYSQFAPNPGVLAPADKANTRENLEKAAAQFESIFLGMWLKSAREATAVIAGENPFSSEHLEMSQEMLDHEMAVHMSNQGGLGMRDVIVRQLGGTVSSDDKLAQVRQRGAELSTNLPDSFLPAKSQTNTLIKHDAILPEAEKIETLGDKGAFFDSPREFVDALRKRIEAIAGDAGLPSLAILGQAALETGWGKHVIQSAKGHTSHNLFGIKANSGIATDNKVSVPTTEFEQGRWVSRTESFKSYNSWEESIADYVSLIKGSSRYQEAVNSLTENEYVNALQNAGYATDPDYAQKILAVVQKIREML